MGSGVGISTCCLVDVFKQWIVLDVRVFVCWKCAVRVCVSNNMCVFTASVCICVYNYVLYVSVCGVLYVWVSRCLRLGGSVSLEIIMIGQIDMVDVRCVLRSWDVVSFSPTTKPCETLILPGGLNVRVLYLANRPRNGREPKFGKFARCLEFSSKSASNFSLIKSLTVFPRVTARDRCNLLKCTKADCLPLFEPNSWNQELW